MSRNSDERLVQTLLIAAAAGIFVLTVGSAKDASAATVEWAGSVDQDWENCDNWADGVCPGETDDIILDDGDVVVLNSEFNLQGTLHIQQGAFLWLYPGANLVNNGWVGNNGNIEIVGGTLDNHEELENALGASINVSTNEDGGVLINRFSATLNNNSNVNLFEGADLLNEGLILDFGWLSTYPGSMLQNEEFIVVYNTFTNSDGGVLNNGTIEVFPDGTFHANTGVQNDGTITIWCGATFTQVSILGTQPVILPCDPAELTGDLIQEIEGTITNNNVKKSLLAPLKQVQKILNDGNPDNDSAACGKLDDFIATVNAKLSSGKLTPGQASDLISDANEIKQAIGC